ncbi:MAG: sporulation protein YqfC [Clostridia bacterium]|nr:sporulation protein YqfC [Clostridia bacterium]MBQ4543604.1 sporulation protein YqfC [Clostridia bacterium]
MRKKEKPVKTIGEKLTTLFDMPQDVVLDSPKITVISDNSLTIENYTGILEYSDLLIRIKTKEKIVSVSGSRLSICVITDSYILIEGIIEFVRWE